jgi:hypothetical protein
LPRHYHSPSSAKLGSRCRRAWAYRYVAKLVPEDPTWAQIESGLVVPVGGERSRALGKEVHARVESHVGIALGREDLAPAEFESLPGRMAHEAIAYLPAFDRIAGVEVPIGSGAPLVVSAKRPEGPDLPTFEVHGIKWAGLIDILEHHEPGGLPLVRDWKTSSDPKKWALRGEALRSDWQANLYALWAAVYFDVEASRLGWTYIASREPIRSFESPATLSREHASRTLEEPADLCRELDEIEDVELAPLNTEACTDYAPHGQTYGCKYHHALGGPCPARVSFATRYRRLTSARTKVASSGELVQLTRKGPRMTEAQAKPTGLAALAAQRKAAQQGTTPPASETPAGDRAAAEGEAPENLLPEGASQNAGPDPTPPAPETHTSGRPLVPRPAAGKGKGKAPEGSLSASLAPLVAELGEAEAMLGEANARIVAAKAALAKALA